jgi:putative aldouronate transport system substrate-binding protein
MKIVGGKPIRVVMEMNTNNTKTGDSRGTALKIIFIALAVLIIIAVMAFIFLRSGGNSGKRETIKIAARSDVMDYFILHGMTAYLEETTNTSIEWMDYGTINLYERVAADVGKEQKDLPDAYLGLGLTKSQIAEFAPDLFMNISNIARSEAQGFSQIINDDVSRLTEMQIDGQIYSYPSFREIYASEYPQKVWINSEWLDQIGAAVPTTPEELYAVLTQFKNTDLNGNGTNDEIPLVMAMKASYDTSFGFLINAYVTSDFDLSNTSNLINVDNDGNLYSPVTQPQFAEALKFIQRLFRENLVNADAYDTDTSVFLSSGVGSELYGVIACPDPMVLFNNVERAAKYIPLPPLNAGNQAVAVKRTPIQTGGFMLAKNTEKTEAALKIGDAMLTMEGTLTLLYGPLDVAWGYADDRNASLGGTTTQWKLLEPFESELPVTIPYWMPASLATSQQAQVGEDGTANLKTTENWQGYLNQVTRELYEPVGRYNLRNFLYNLPDIVLNDSQELELSQYGNVRSEVFDYVYEECRRFVTSDADIDAEFPKFIEELSTRGLDKFIELMQEAYNDRMS